MNQASQNNQIPEDERLAGRMVLNILPRSASHQGFDQSILDDYFSGRISKDEEDAFFAYLDSNLDAYHAWVEQAKTQTTQKSPTPSTGSLSSILARIKEMFSLPSHGFAYAGVTCAVMALVIVFALPSSTPNAVNHRLDESFALLNAVPTFDQTIVLVMPWDTPSDQQAFSPAPETLPEEAAFAHGLIIGQAALTADKAQDANSPQTMNSNKDLAPYTHLGRWNILVWTACLNQENIPNTFWSQQIETAELLRESLSHTENDIFTNHLNTTIQLLTQIASAKQKSGLSKKLLKELEQFRLLYAPRETPQA